MTIEDKLKIIELVDSGNSSRQSIGNQFGIGKSTVHDIHKRKEKIQQFALMRSAEDICKRRRVDIRTQVVNVKEEIDIGEEEMTDSIEGFDYQEINENDYEIVYEAGCTMPTIPAEVSNNSQVQAVTPKPKRKSRTLTFREKYDLITRIENGSTVPFVCDTFGIGRTTVYDIMRRKQEIVDFVEKSNGVDRRTFKTSKFPEVEERVIAWCENQESFSKSQFYDFARTVFEQFKECGASVVPSGFCGSWSWSKRFFNRHPQLKLKLFKGPEEQDDEEVVEYLDENINEVKPTKIKAVELKKKSAGGTSKLLTVEEKFQVLDEIDAGKQVAEIASRHLLEKSTIYEIFKRRNELRALEKTNQPKRNTRPPKYPELELELLQWCLKQKTFPLSNVLIAEKALCLFDSLGLKGNFNPSYGWAKKFVSRHSELCEKQGIFYDGLPELHDESLIENSGDESQEREPPDSYDYSPYAFPPDYQEEYIVEELESTDDNVETTEANRETSSSADPLNSPNKVIQIVNSTDSRDEPLIAHDKALQSVKNLIKYSSQQGHIHFLSQLIDYQNQLQFEVS